jgi:hypothetical protein
MWILKAGVLYFSIVFGAGFVLGPIRILWVVPRFGTRMAELMETPIMFVVIIIAARWIVRRLALPPTASSRLGMGSIALGLMLVAEFTLVLWFRGLSISEYLASRVPADALQTGGHRWNQIRSKRDADGRPGGVGLYHEKKARLWRTKRASSNFLETVWSPKESGKETL